MTYDFITTRNYEYNEKICIWVTIRVCKFVHLMMLIMPIKVRRSESLIPSMSSNDSQVDLIYSSEAFARTRGFHADSSACCCYSKRHKT